MIQQVPIDQIKIPDRPFREDPPEIFEAMKQSIQNNGIVTAVTVRQLARDKYEIIDGISRVRVAIALRFKTVPVQVVDYKAFGIVPSEKYVKTSDKAYALGLIRLWELHPDWSLNQLALEIRRDATFVITKLRSQLEKL